MTETTPTPAVLLALNNDDAIRARSQLEHSTGERIDALWTLDRHKRTDPLEYIVEGEPTLYVTSRLNGDPGAIAFLAAVRGANATHEIRVLDEADTWRGPKAAPEPATRTSIGAGRPAPTEDHVWIYVRGAGWWDGPWTISAGRATDTEGTVVFLEHVAAWSDVPLTNAAALPGTPPTLYEVAPA